MPTQTLPSRLFSADDAAKIDRHVIDQLGVPGYCLMKRAAQATFEVMRYHFPQARSLLVLAGGGNNSGDGYALATIAHQAGWRVQVLVLVPPPKLDPNPNPNPNPSTNLSVNNEAAQAAADCLACGVPCQPFNESEPLPAADVIIDALFGIGLCRPIESGDFAKAVRLMNASTTPVIALDVPSGLSADTGHPLGLVVQATVTVTFIVVKPGLLTGQGPDYVGELWLDDLGVSAETAAAVSAGLKHWHLGHLPAWPSRPHASHKGSFGDVLIVGGDTGMAGAAVLAAEAAVCGGAGRVTLVTRPEHLTAALMRCPEVLSAAVSDVTDAEVAEQLAPLLEKASVVVLGPGLGTASWGIALANAVISAAMDRRSLHLVLDADALNLVAKGVLNWTDAIGSQTIMTPHPREAARLLSALLPPVDVDQIGPTQEKQSKVASVQSVQANRLAAAQQLVVAYGANLLIKGAGTVIASLGVSTGEPELCSLGVCSQGNPGMAVAGMGDVLSGLLGALLAQGVPPAEAVGMGVVIHAAAGDALWQQGESPSIRPTELLAAIQKVMGAMRQEVPSLMTTAAEV